jgi:hypothetical protein
MITPTVVEIGRGAHPAGCAVCMSHTRPQDVPAAQHAIGCTVRTGLLARSRTLEDCVDSIEKR